jgi:hypothetical protein
LYSHLPTRKPHQWFVGTQQAPYLKNERRFVGFVGTFERCDRALSARAIALTGSAARGRAQPAGDGTFVAAIAVRMATGDVMAV